MHKHRDDVAGVPFLFLTPTRRPISRPSSRASTPSRLYPARPDTPTSAPASPLAHVFRRPHTPATSPLAPMSSKSDYSPSSSPILAHTQTVHAQFTASLPASPLSSPRLLNAKANEFRPIPRPLSAAASTTSGSLLRSDTPSPDLWSHNSSRATSNLAIAAPLIADHPSLTCSLTTSSLRTSHRPKDEPDDEDPFDPFPTNQISSFHSITISDFDTSDTMPWSTSPPQSATQDHYYTYGEPNGQIPDQDSDEASAALADGMTPFDVLSSIFGSTLAPSELEDALAANGYDFDRAMAWLVDRALPIQGPQNRMQYIGPRLPLASRDGAIPRGAGPGTGRGFGSPPTSSGRSAAPRYVNGRPATGGNRVCRYFVAGECLRADCRFRFVCRVGEPA